jgi:hypothetical protein
MDIPMALSGLFYESMKRIIGHYRWLFVASVMVLLVGVVALSTTTRQPCLRACSGPWHTYKAGRMAQPEPFEMPVAKATESAEVVVAETEAPPRRYVPEEEAFPVALPMTFQKHHFRSPPVLD